MVTRFIQLVYLCIVIAGKHRPKNLINFNTQKLESFDVLPGMDITDYPGKESSHYGDKSGYCIS